MEHTPPNALLKSGEPCPEYPHVHVSMEPWLLLKGDTHLTCRCWLRSCDGGSYLSAYTLKVSGPCVRSTHAMRQELGWWQRFWWHLTRTGPWFTSRSSRSL